MGPNPSLMLFVFLVLVGLASSSYISYQALEPSSPTGRNLLSKRISYRHCSINFDVQNYGVITSQCKGPDYNPKICCGAFKRFACPFIHQINDLASDCATNMFRNLHIHYPAGLFSDMCVEGPRGLACPSA